MEDFPETIHCNVMISAAHLVPTHLIQDTIQLSSPAYDKTHADLAMARCIAIVDKPIFCLPSEQSQTLADAVPEASLVTPEMAPNDMPPQIDTGVLVFPPSTVPGGSTTFAATVLVTGESSMATPKGKCLPPLFAL